MSKAKISIIVITLVLLIDQTLKIWIKTHLALGEYLPVFDHWFYLHFIENNGMAFGMELGGSFGKIILSVFRIFAVIAILWYIVHLVKKDSPTGLIVCFSLIFAGALGNILDSAFYGIIFNSSYPGQVAALFPASGGYSTFLHGKVVDMLYFEIINSRFPSWFPFWGNEQFIFFSPRFNIADSSISIGVFFLFIFNKKYFKS
jgi:signal peptidase II